MEQNVGYAVNLLDPALRETVRVRFWGRTVRQGGAPDPSTDAAVVRALSGATTNVISRALAAQQVAMPTLAHSLAYFSPQIVEGANQELAASAIQLTALELSCEVPQSSVAPAAAAIAAAPSPLESAASNFTSNVADEIASSVPSHLNVNVGGFRVGVGADGVDGNQLGDQAGEAVKSHLLHYAIIGGVLLLVSFLCCGAIAFKLLF